MVDNERRFRNLLATVTANDPLVSRCELDGWRVGSAARTFSAPHLTNATRLSSAQHCTAVSGTAPQQLCDAAGLGQ